MEVFDLKRFRKDNSLTQKQVSELLSCKQSFISRVEKGIRPFPENMMDILQSVYGDISGYISVKDNLESDPVVINATPQEFLSAGAEAFARQTVQMMNDKLIAPYGLLGEKDKEIERLNRIIGKLEERLEANKKTNAQEDDTAICADAR